MTRGESGELGERLVTLALLIAVVSGALAGSAVVGAAAGPADESRAAGPAPAFAQDRNNTTIHHQNPDEVGERENLSGVEGWLAGEMSERLSESGNISQADRERASELIGNDSEYAELARKHAEVSNETGNDSQNLDRFEDARQSLQALYRDVDEYESAHEEYERARQRGNESRELELAHELERRSAEVNRSADRANRSYENISTEAEFDVENATESVGQVRANVTSTQETVRDRTLVRTRLSVRAVDGPGSFTDPVTLAGRLETEDGEAIGGENVTLVVGSRTLNASTDDRGRFEVPYRPTLARTGTQSRAFRFRPSNESAYVGANATASFGVQQVTPSVTVSNYTETLRYNETLVVNGTVEAGDRGAPAVPVVVTVDGVPMNRTETDANGSFGVAARLPANVSAGDRRVEVRLPLSDRALAPATATAPVTVERTPTSISIADAQRSEETVFVSGRLVAGDDAALANKTVELRVNGTTVGTARTNATGAYAGTVGIPSESLDGAESVRVTAAYAGAGENLDGARANATVALPAAGPRFGDGLLVRALGVLGVGALGAFLVRRFRSDDRSLADDSTAEDADPHATDPPDDRERSGEPLFDAARGHLDDGRFDAAAVAAYAAVRRRLDAERATGRTHWEFYDACSDAGLPVERLRDLKRLTETYERAAFSASSIPDGDAAEAVSLATSFRSESAGSGGGSAIGDDSASGTDFAPGNDPAPGDD